MFQVGLVPLTDVSLGQYAGSHCLETFCFQSRAHVNTMCLVGVLRFNNLGVDIYCVLLILHQLPEYFPVPMALAKY